MADKIATLLGRWAPDDPDDFWGDAGMLDYSCSDLMADIREFYFALAEAQAHIAAQAERIAELEADAKLGRLVRECELDY